MILLLASSCLLYIFSDLIFYCIMIAYWVSGESSAMSQTALISALILMCFLSLAAFFQWIIFLRMNNTSTTFKKSQEELEQEETEESEIDKRIMLDSNDADVQKAFFGEDNSGKKTATTDLDPL